MRPGAALRSHALALRPHCGRTAGAGWGRHGPAALGGGLPLRGVRSHPKACGRSLRGKRVRSHCTVGVWGMRAHCNATLSQNHHMSRLDGELIVILLAAILRWMVAGWFGLLLVAVIVGWIVFR